MPTFWQENFSLTLLPHITEVLKCAPYADIEDGHTLHLVERPEGVAPSDPNQEPQQQQQGGHAGHHFANINFGMINAQNLIGGPGVSADSRLSGPPLPRQCGASKSGQILMQ